VTLRPTLWEGEFSCACGYRAHAVVLGRRGHRYDELEVVELPEDQPQAEEDVATEKYIHETYDAEARGVIDVLACPKCGKRPGIGREMKRLGVWTLVLTAMSVGVALVLWSTSEPLAAKAAIVATLVAIAARAYVFVMALREAAERTRLTPR
jgi:hypothetical protein